MGIPGHFEAFLVALNLLVFPGEFGEIHRVAGPDVRHLRGEEGGGQVGEAVLRAEAGGLTPPAVAGELHLGGTDGVGTVPLVTGSQTGVATGPGDGAGLDTFACLTLALVTDLVTTVAATG